MSQSERSYFRIAQWNEIYENNRTRELKRLEWVLVPNKMDGSGYCELVDHPNGAAHFGAWVAMVEIASRQKVRGDIPQGSAGGIETVAQTLARISRLPREVFEEALPRIVALGWIELINPEQNQQDVKIPQEGAGLSHSSAKKWPLKGIEGNGIELPPNPHSLPPQNGGGKELIRMPTPTPPVKRASVPGSESVNLAGLTRAEFVHAWGRHHKRRNNEPMDFGVRMIMSFAEFDADLFRRNHAAYCDYFDRCGWDDYGKALTFCGWIQNGMPLPPPEAKPSGKAGRPSLGEMLADIDSEDEAAGGGR